MKKGLLSRLSALLLTAVLLSSLSTSAFAQEQSGYDMDYYSQLQGKDVTINVYNWGEYISNGDDDSLDVNAEFEALTGIRVNYTQFDTNESLYAKLKSGGTTYDVIFPSDYMVSRMIAEDMLEPLDFENIPNFQYISDRFKNPSYDPENLYSVPYMWGLLGVIYNSAYIDPAEKDVETWDILWDEELSGHILMFNNSRDAIGIALKKLGYSYNTEDPAQVKEATNLLVEQKPLVQSYVMDEIFDKLEGENALIGAYYYGDFLTMQENNPDLAFALPREGTNLYVDAMCIPKGAENKENAEKFINFMCSTQAGLKNCEEIWYSSPLLSVREELDPETANDPYAYPTDDVYAKTESFACLSPEIRELYNSEWIRLLK